MRLASGEKWQKSAMPTIATLGDRPIARDEIAD
jgi:hypothetical protein